MSEGPIAKVVEAPAQAAAIAKQKPWAVAFIVVGVGILILRYPTQTKNFLVGLPLVGPVFAKLIG